VIPVEDCVDADGLVSVAGCLEDNDCTSDTCEARDRQRCVRTLTPTLSRKCIEHREHRAHLCKLPIHIGDL
jgi:hypothetical protein